MTEGRGGVGRGAEGISFKLFKKKKKEKKEMFSTHPIRISSNTVRREIGICENKQFTHTFILLALTVRQHPASHYSFTTALNQLNVPH